MFFEIEQVKDWFRKNMSSDLSTIQDGTYEIQINGKMFDCEIKNGKIFLRVKQNGGKK